MEKVIETHYRILENVDEVKKAFESVPENSKVIPMIRLVDEETYLPQVGFRLVQPHSSYYITEYYVAAIEHLIDSGVDIKKYELQETRLWHHE